MDQGDFHILIAERESQDQIKLAGLEHIRGAPVREDVAVHKEDHTITVEVEVCMGHIAEQGAACIIRTGKVGLVVKEPAAAGIDREVLFGER